MRISAIDDGHFSCGDGHIFRDDGYFFFHVGQIFFHVEQKTQIDGQKVINFGHSRRERTIFP
jgi:hypothetical protein